MNGGSDSKIVLTHTEIAPWKRVVVEHTDMSKTSCKMFTLLLVRRLSPITNVYCVYV